MFFVRRIGRLSMAYACPAPPRARVAAMPLVDPIKDAQSQRNLRHGTASRIWRPDAGRPGGQQAMIGLRAGALPRMRGGGGEGGGREGARLAARGGGRGVCGVVGVRAGGRSVVRGRVRGVGVFFASWSAETGADAKIDPVGGALAGIAKAMMRPRWRGTSIILRSLRGVWIFVRWWRGRVRGRCGRTVLDLRARPPVASSMAKGRIGRCRREVRIDHDEGHERTRRSTGPPWGATLSVVLSRL